MCGEVAQNLTEPWHAARGDVTQRTEHHALPNDAHTCIYLNGVMGSETVIRGRGRCLHARERAWEERKTWSLYGKDLRSAVVTMTMTMAMTSQLPVNKELTCPQGQGALAVLPPWLAKEIR